MAFRFRAAAAALLLMACGEGNAGQFTINFSFNTDTGGCTSESCGEYGMNCGAVLSVRIIEADTGNVVGSVCEDVSPNDTLCTLGNLPPSSSIFFNLPPKMLRIEVASWSRDVLDADPELTGTCPEIDIFDLKGVPLTTFQPQPAFAGAAYFNAASADNSTTVSLACTDPEQLNTIDCAPTQIPLIADVFNTERLRPVTAEQPSLLVRVAEPRQTQIDDETVTEINNQSSVNLVREGTTERFSTLIDEGTLGSNQCTLVLEQTPQATTSVICGNVSGNKTSPRLAALLEKETLDEILAALGLATFPEQGLVIGRVYEEATGVPLPNVTMVPGGVASPIIEYLNSSRDGVLGLQTFDNGYFIAQDIPFGTTWTATDPNGMVPSRPLVSGLIQNNLSLLLVPMVLDPKVEE